MSYEERSIDNGPGFRVALFFSGCSLRCKGCWNPRSWRKQNGELVGENMVDKVLNDCAKEYISGLSLLGGETFENIPTALHICRLFRQRFGGSKTIYMWSGYTFEQILQDKQKVELLELGDVLIDGRFELDKRDLRLYLRGSTNQRILDIKRSLAAEEPVELDS